MKKIKSVLSLLLCFTLILSLFVPAFAVEQTADGTSVSTVAHSVNAEFTASIPAYVMPGEPGEASADYTVTLENAVIPDSHELTAKVEYSGTMREQNGVELPYELLDETGNTISSGAKILSKSAGTPTEAVSVSFGAALTAKAKYAGVYTDTAKFTFDVAEKVYTLDEINADEHLFAIGQTKPEYVVAQFNEDYTEVTILKNGADSDGAMKSLARPIDNPFQARKNTLSKLTIRNGITTIGTNAFYGCSSLTGKLVIPDSVIEIGSRAFRDCPNLTGDLVIPDSVTKIGDNGFFGCKGLTSLQLGNSIERIEAYAFESCTGLVGEVIIPDSVVSLGEFAFCLCENLESVTLPSSLKKINKEAFYACKALANVTLPDTITDIGYEAFAGCESLTTIFIPNSVKTINETAFFRCFKLEEIRVSDGNNYFCSEDGVLFNKEKSQLLKCPETKTGIYDIPESVKIIGNYAFSNCQDITGIMIPENVTTIKTLCNLPKTIPVYGKSGSYAETWATENGYTFVAQ